MPPLKNINKEQFTDKYIEHEGNGKRAYLAVPAYDCSENSAEKSASRLLRSVEIRERIVEKLTEQKGTNPDDLSRKYKSLLERKRPIIIKDKLEYVEDNACQLETAKTLTKIYGALGVTDQGSYQDNRSINISVSSNDITSLSTIIKRLSDIELRQDKVSGLIQEGMVRTEEIGGGGGIDEV